MNFVPGDGVTANQIFNNGLPQVPDYAVVADDEGNLVSRWFVIEYTRTRNGQYSVQLYRDTIADSHEPLQNALVFCEKANVADTNPLIYNSENLNLNQIKTEEYLLKDQTACPWIVGYYARRTSATDENGNTTTPYTTLQGEVANPLARTPDLTYEKLSAYPYFNAVSLDSQTRNEGFYDVPDRITYSVTYQDTTTNIVYMLRAVCEYPMTQKNWTVSQDAMTSLKSGSYQYAGIPDFTVLANALNARTTDLINDHYKQFYERPAGTTYVPNGWHKPDQVTAFLATMNKTILIESNHTTYISSIPEIKSGSKSKSTSTLTNLAFPAVLLAQGFTAQAANPFIVTSYTAPMYMGKLTRQLATNVKYNITTDRYHCADAYFDAFAIPYSDNFKFTGPFVNTSGQTSTQTVTSNAALNLATAIEMATTSLVYDLQLLPYCPLDFGDNQGSYTATDPKEFSWLRNETNAPIGVVFNVQTSNRSFSINAPKSEGLISNNVKLDTQTTICRLNSPNYDGTFEFTPTKNGGVSYFRVDCTFKPYQPYIHVAPAWGGLYGRDFGDARGLICGGDFGLPRLQDEWKQYQLNNKNYLNSFNRQIENMETNNYYQEKQDIVNAITGTLAGAAGGATGGAMTKTGPAGMLIGAGIGMAASVFAGIEDVRINKALRAEALDYTQDQFGFQMGNIKARPTTLARVGALNTSNKLYPFVEIWTCTTKEREAVAAKIALNGMSVGVAGTFGDFINVPWTATVNGKIYHSQNYIKAKLIKITNIGDESHYTNTLGNELNMGVYWAGDAELPEFITEVV